jgi:hypothetical protein
MSSGDDWSTRPFGSEIAARDNGILIPPLGGCNQFLVLRRLQQCTTDSTNQRTGPQATRTPPQFFVARTLAHVLCIRFREEKGIVTSSLGRLEVLEFDR